MLTRMQTITVVLKSGDLLQIQLIENAIDDIVVMVTPMPVKRNGERFLSWLPLEITRGRKGLTAKEAMQQAWTYILKITKKSNECIDVLEVDSFELLSKDDILEITGLNPIFRI